MYGSGTLFEQHEKIKNRTSQESPVDKKKEPLVNGCPLPYGHIEGVMHGIRGKADQLKL